MSAGDLGNNRMSDRSGQDDITALLSPFRAAASPLRAFLRDLHAKYQGLRDGAVADYIPELDQGRSRLVRHLPS